MTSKQAERSRQIEAAYDDLERTELIAKNGQFRRGQPVYVSTKWGNRLEQGNRALFDRILDAASNPELLQKIFAENKTELDHYRG
jgi:hypothetical protein